MNNAVTANGAGDALILAAGQNFVNNSGSTALNAGSGRWLVYSTSPAGSTENGLTAAAGSTSPRLYNKTFAGNAPATIAAGNHLIYSSQPTLTVTAANQSRAYGAGDAFTVTTTGFISDDGVTDTATTAGLSGAASLTSPATATSPVSGPTFAITAAAGTLASSADYAFSFAPGTLTIIPANLILSGTRVYNGTTIFAGSNLTATGVNGETFTVTGAGASGNLGTKNVQTNQALASVTGLALGTGNSGAAVSTNYNALATNNSSVSVTPKALTIAGFASNNKTYDGTTTAIIATSGTLSGVVSGDTVGFSNTGATFDTKNVGTGKTVTLNGVALTGGDQQNYNYTATTTDLSDITPATLTYAANAANRLYGSANPGFSGTVTGFVNSETLTTATAGSLAFTSTATAANNIGGYAILGSGLTANNGNYVFAQAVGNATALSINPAPLTVTADNKSRAPGIANPALTATYTGFVNGDTSAVVSGLSLATTATLSSPTGSYPITASGATASNYTLTFVGGILAVGQNLLTITADNKIKTYGAALPTFTASFVGFVNGDTAASVTGLQFSTTATMGSNVGTFTITPFGATAPSTYLIGYVPGTLTISPTALTLTANNVQRLYGAANPAFGASYSGFVNGDTSAVVSGLVFSTPATPTSGVGGYAITPSGATAPNYSLTFVPGTLTIDRAPLTLTASNASREFGAANPAFTATFSGFVNNDTSAVVSGLLFNTSATAASAVGEYFIVPLGATAANYTLVFVNGTLRVVAPTVAGGATPATVATINQQPVLTPEFAVILLGDRLTLVSVNSPGGILTVAGGGAGSTDGRLALTLGQATGLPGFGSATAVTGGSVVGGAASTNALNLGGFELVTSFADGSGGSRINPAQPNEPGLFRESTVNMGGFNVVYHEALAASRQQEESNTALGSSYREFSDSDNPQFNIVRAKVDRKPADPAAGPNPTD
ncbi:MAG: MBG domain-containing protein [Candidatus Didemnitutus sp.]|nr:MBG domain-containing protein [Candidatus Didemnitutus sp.]